MKLVLLLLVLGARRLESPWPQWLRGWRPAAAMNALSESGPARLPPVVHWLVVVLLPAVGVGALVFYLRAEVWAPLAWLVGGLVLLWLLGPDSENRRIDEALVCGRMNDDAGLARAAQSLGVTGEPDQSDFFVQLYHRVLWIQAVQLFAVTFWLVVLGYWAALLYALNHWWLRSLSARADSGAADTQRKTPVVLGALDKAMHWLPNRLLMGCMGLAGDWQALRTTAQGRFLKLDEDPDLLCDALNAALGEREAGPPADRATAMDRLEAQQALLLRCLALWLLLAAVWTLLV